MKKHSNLKYIAELDKRRQPHMQSLQCKIQRGTRKSLGLAKWSDSSSLAANNWYCRDNVWFIRRSVDTNSARRRSNHKNVGSWRGASYYVCLHKVCIILHMQYLRLYNVVPI